MSYLGSWAIDDLLTFVVNTQVFATGVATDADAVPSYRVYEDETTTPLLTGTMALLDSANTAGYYSEQITLSAANGFEAGKCYSIYIAATVSGVAGATHRTFQILAKVNTTAVGGTAQTGGDLAALITAVDDYVDTEVAAILAAVDTEVAAILALLDDARGEPAQGAPPVNPDMATKVDYLYKFARNQKTQNATTLSIFADDAVTVDHKATISDDGATYTHGEIVSGV